MSSRVLSPLTATRAAPPVHRLELDVLPAAILTVKNSCEESGDQVKLFTQRSRFSVRSDSFPVARSEHHQTPAVAFVAGPDLRALGEIFAVRRILRRIVRAADWS